MRVVDQSSQGISKIPLYNHFDQPNIIRHLGWTILDFYRKREGMGGVVVVIEM